MFGDYWILWYSISNSYSVINSDFELLLGTYLASNTQKDFSNTLSDQIPVSDSLKLSETIHNYLKDCNNRYSPPNTSSDTLDTSHRNISKHYVFGSKRVQIYYSSELVLKTVHPSIAHYCKTSSKETDVSFDIYLKNDIYMPGMYIIYLKHFSCFVYEISIFFVVKGGFFHSQLKSNLHVRIIYGMADGAAVVPIFRRRNEKILNMLGRLSSKNSKKKYVTLGMIILTTPTNPFANI